MFLCNVVLSIYIASFSIQCYLEAKCDCSRDILINSVLALHICGLKIKSISGSDGVSIHIWIRKEEINRQGKVCITQ